MDKFFRKSDRVRVDGDSVLARFADWQSHVKGRPVAALGPETRAAALFVADEVIIDGKDEALADELKRRYGAEVVPELPLPPRPAQFRQERRIALDEMPQALRLRFRTPPRIEDAGRLLEQAGPGMSRSHRQMVVTSELGAAVAAVVARHALEGRPIGLNLFGDTLAMPLSTAQDGAVPGVSGNPFTWPAFAGRTRMAPAWQLIDSIRQVRGDRFTTIGILDHGFWLDNRGVPMVAAGQAASDFPNFVQVNLQNEGQPAGGMSPNGGGPWHGNAVASAAAAVVNNSLGAAGTGGTIAIPVFLQTDISIDQFLRAVRLCAAWGIDVLNMSIGMWGEPELSFPTSIWDRTFQFAFDNDVVMVAAAGNSILDLPDADEHVRPATRTPGVLTVGALDANDNAWINATSPGVGSNFGSSVWLWAPGTSIPVVPDGNPANVAGSRVTGTSFASPIVAGVAAMMRFANDQLSAADIRRLLIDTGWAGTGRVSKGLDAFAAVFAAIHQTLPDTEEPNNSSAKAANLVPIGATGALGPSRNGFSTRSSSTDPDFWKFKVDGFSTVTVAVDWYQSLSTLFVAVEADDPEARGIEEMTTSGGPATGRLVLMGLLPPGGYRVRVGGSGITGYRLLVTRRPASLPGDMFEDNDSFAQAPRMLFESTPWTAFGLRTWGPGTYDATLHQEPGVPVVTGGVGGLLMDDDYFRLEVPNSGANVLRRAAVSIHDADKPVDVTLFDAAQAVIRTWTGVRNVTEYPPQNSTCYLKVSAATPTRYQISTRMKADPRTVPGPNQEELDLIPKWWGDPSPLYLTNQVTHYVLEVNQNRGDGEAVAFHMPDDAVRLELLDHATGSIRDARPVDGKLLIDTRGMAAGPYVVRVSKQAAAPRAIVELRTAPPLR